MTLNEYLAQLADGQSPDGGRDVETPPVTEEEMASIDQLELEWKSLSCISPTEVITIEHNSPNLRLLQDAEDPNKLQSNSRNIVGWAMPSMFILIAFSSIVL